ncbi:hypothetical protein BDR06DRAFT_963756 [Suillus hirtellus]|nr:hypothetical protein BDR06DRAFT_963756 [Suillus hirtellus]
MYLNKGHSQTIIYEERYHRVGFIVEEIPKRGFEIQKAQKLHEQPDYLFQLFS